MKKIIITTAQFGATVNKRFFKNLKLFVNAKKIDTVYIFAVKGRYKEDFRLTNTLERLTKIGGADVVILHSTPKAGIPLNRNLKLFHSQILPQNVNPFWGLQPKLSRQHSYIMNATKSRFEVVGTSNHKRPRTFTSTGAITNPRYKEHTAIGTKGREAHTFGFVYVEIPDNKYFKVRPIIASQSGNFTFQQSKFSYGKIVHEKTKAIVLGDIHRAVLDEKAVAESKLMIDAYDPQYVVIHDLTDLKSINHHEAHSFLKQIARHTWKYDSLEKELQADMAFMSNLAELFPAQKFLIVESNHDAFIEKYIDTQQFMKDPQNVLFVSRMLNELVYNKGNKPILQIAFDTVGWKCPNNISFINHDKEFRIGGKLVSFHGHKGISGSRGTPTSYERNNLKAVLGHSHSPSLFSNGGVTGHLTDISKQDYARGGISRWLQANIIIDSLNKLHMMVLDSNFK